MPGSVDMTAVKRHLLIAVSLLVGGFVVVAVAQDHPAQAHRHAEGQALGNPFEATPDSIATGRQWYVFMCRECHGNAGRGDGDMAHAGGVPSDFTDDVWQHGKSDGEIFLVIQNGVSADMQPYKDRVSADDIWHLVNYLKSFGPKRD